MTPRQLHGILDAELSKARTRRAKPHETSATVKVINAKLSYLRFQYQVMRDSGVQQDFGGLISVRAPIEGKSRRIKESAKILQLKAPKKKQA